MTRTVLLLFASLAGAADWSNPVEVRHEDALAVAYTARVDGPYLVVRATVGEGWHTFSLDNEKRVTEKLAGQPALSMDKPTEIAATGLQVEGGWLQSPPKEFSRPELRMYAFGYDREAIFAAKIRRCRWRRQTAHPRPGLHRDHLQERRCRPDGRRTGEVGDGGGDQGRGPDTRALESRSRHPRRHAPLILDDGSLQRIFQLAA